MLFIVGSGCRQHKYITKKRHVYPLVSLVAIGQLYCSIPNIDQRITVHPEFMQRILAIDSALMEYSRSVWQV